MLGMRCCTWVTTQRAQGSVAVTVGTSLGKAGTKPERARGKRCRFLLLLLCLSQDRGTAALPRQPSAPAACRVGQWHRQEWLTQEWHTQEWLTQEGS